MTKKLLLPFLLLAFLFVSCEKEGTLLPEPEPEIAERTVLVYIMGQNSLSGFIQADVDEMKQAVAAGALGDNNRLILYIDDYKKPRLLRLKRSPSGEAVCDTISRYNEQTSVDADQMRSIFTETFKKFPADSYGLILWSHGDGWLPDESRSKKVITRWIGTDDGNSGPKMEIPELVSVLKQFPKFEFIFFDACFMQSIEVIYELRNYTKYVIGSPTETPGPGAPYQYVIAPLFEKECNIDKLINDYFIYYTDGRAVTNDEWPYGCAISAIKCENLDALVGFTRSIIIAHTDYLNNPNITDIQKYDQRSLCRYYDLNGFIKSIASEEEYLQWRLLLEECAPAAFQKSSPKCYSAYIGREFKVDLTQYSGISTYIMQPKDSYSSLNSYYKQLEWYAVSGWNQTAY